MNGIQFFLTLTLVSYIHSMPNFFLVSLILHLSALAGSGTCNFIEDESTVDVSLISEAGCPVASKVCDSGMLKFGEF